MATRLGAVGLAMLILFKEAGLREYLQQNLRILSAVAGDLASTAYGPRWQAEDVVDNPPEPGETALVVFSDPPHESFVAARFAEVVTSDRNEYGYLHLTLKLGAYPHVPNQQQWLAAVASWPNPRSAERAFMARADVAGVVTESPDPQRSWERIADRLSRNSAYERAAFARLTSIAGDGGEHPLGAVDEVPELEVGSQYVMRIAHHDPHLPSDVRRDMRLLLMFDELLTSAVLIDSQGIDVTETEILVEPLTVGPATIEVQVSRGAEFLPIAWLSWQAIEPLVKVETAEDPAEPPRSVDALAAAAADPVGATERDQVDAVTASRALGEALVRGYKMVEGHLATEPGKKLELLATLRTVAPDDTRLRELEGIALYESGQDDAAARTLMAVPMEVLGGEGRSVLIAATIRRGFLPEPIEQVQVADWSSEQTFARLVDASAGLRSPHLLALTLFLIENALAEVSGNAWLSAVIARPNAKPVTYDLLDLWQYVNPAAAGEALANLLATGRLSLTEARVARLAYELGTGDLGGMRIDACRALLDGAERNSDLPTLHKLLDDIRLPGSGIQRSDMRELGEEIVHLIADLTPDKDPIDAALLAAAEFVEDHRQAGELDHASAIATFARSNLSRAGKETRDRVTAAASELEVALETTETFRKFARLREQEVNLDVRKAVAGLRFLLIGGKRADWFAPLVQELALHQKSEWMESERQKAPDNEAIKARLVGGQWAAMILFTTQVGHKTSEPIQRLAKQHEVLLVTPKQRSRDSLLASLREHFVKG